MGMRNKIVYSLIGIAFVGGLFSAAYAGPALTNITLGGNVDVLGDAHVAAGKSLFVDTIEPESESFVFVPSGLEVLGFSGFQNHLSILKSSILCIDDSAAGTFFDCLDGDMIVAESVTSNEIQDGTIQGVDISLPLVLAGTSQFNTVKASLFRDLDDTFFFANPASTSVFKALNVDDVAVANDIICTDCIDSADILDGTIKGIDIAVGAIGGVEIGANAVGAGEIRTDAVRADEIQAGAVGSSEIADGQVMSVDIADDAVTGAKIAGISKLIFGQCGFIVVLNAGEAGSTQCSGINGAVPGDIVIASPGYDWPDCLVLIKSLVNVADKIRITFQNICTSTDISSIHNMDVIVYDLP